MPKFLKVEGRRNDETKPNCFSLCGDSYQDISLLAAVNEAQKLNAKGGNTLVLYLSEENAITQTADIVVVSKPKLDALRTTLLFLILDLTCSSFADKRRF